MLGLNHGPAAKQCSSFTIITFDDAEWVCSPYLLNWTCISSSQNIIGLECPHVQIARVLAWTYSRIHLSLTVNSVHVYILCVCVLARAYGDYAVCVHVHVLVSLWIFVQWLTNGAWGVSLTSTAEIRISNQSGIVYRVTEKLRFDISQQSQLKFRQMCNWMSCGRIT